MRQILLLLGFFLSINLSGQALSKKELRYIPKDLNDALIYLDKIIQDSTKTRIKSMSEEDFLSQTHLTTGMWIRNYWLYNRYIFGLIVTKSDLRKDLVSKGLFTNDDMSGVILRSYHRKLNNKDIQLDDQIKNIHQWYLNMNNPAWRVKQDSISWSNLMRNYAIGDTLTKDIYYKRNWLGTPQKNATIMAQVVDKSERQLKINIFSFGMETDRALIYNEIECDSTVCWVNPYLWKKEEK